MESPGTRQSINSRPRQQWQIQSRGLRRRSQEARPNSRNNCEKEKAQMCSDAETEWQFSGEPHGCELSSLPPSSVRVPNSRDESIDNSQRPESSTPNIIHSPLSGQEQSGWKRRSRFGKIPDEREPQQGRVCALEKAMRSYVDRKSGQVVAPEIGREFDSLEEAFEFYNLLGRLGLAYDMVNLGQMHRRAEPFKTVCGCAGRPKKENTKSLASNCQALIRLHRTHDNGWYIHDFRPEHNHHLSSSCGEKLHWPSHRNIDTHTKDIVKHLRRNNIGITKVFCVIASFFGSMENVPFNKRSLKYMCKRMNQETADDDIRKTVELFSELKKNDPMFADNVLVDSDGKIQALMWTNGRSRY